MPHPWEEVFWQISHRRDRQDDKCPTNAPGGMGTLGIDWAIIRTCLLVSARTRTLLTHNFFIVDKGRPIITWRWCLFQSRQTDSYTQKSGSHLALISRCNSILAIGGFYHLVVNTSVDVKLSGVEKVSRLHSTEKSLDRLSTTIWAGVGQVNWAHDLHRLLTNG